MIHARRRAALFSLFCAGLLGLIAAQSGYFDPWLDLRHTPVLRGVMAP